MSDRTYSQRKVAYSQRLRKLLDEYKIILVVHTDHVGSKQLQEIRIELRGRAVMLMGKNTMIRRVIREAAVDNPIFENLLPHIQSNVGLVFTNENAKDIRDVVLANLKPAAARPGVVATCDVFVPAGPTGCDPGQTSFFQALNIATKIVRGCIEITNEVHLVKKGSKCGNSEVELLAKLNMRPFAYGVVVKQIFDNGATYSSEVLDLTDDDLVAKFTRSVSRVAALSLAIGYPTMASLPHSFANAFKKMLAVSVATDYTFEEAKKFKEYLENPDAFVVAAPTAAAVEEAAPAAAEEESEEESEASFDLFD